MNLDAIGIYAIVNNEDGHFTTYIGSTTQSFKHRWATHKARLRGKRHCNAFLQNAWIKYGEKAFVFEIIETTEDKSKVPFREAIWIDFYRMHVPLYNLSLRLGTNDHVGHPHTEDTKRKIQMAVSGENHYMYGKKLPKETKEKIREALTGLKNPFYGRRHSKESKKKQSAAKSGENNPFYGRRLSKEHRTQIARAKAKKYPALYNTETREIIPPGINLTALCRKRGFSQGGMSLLVRGIRKSYRGWIVSNTKRIEEQVKCRLT
jgi:group I intron endonuclease